MEWLPTPVFWPGEFHGLYPWSHKESDTDRTTFISLQVKGSAMTVWLLAISPIDILDLFLILLSKQLNQLWIPVSHTPSSMPPPSRIQN